ncbi:amidase [Brachybacterium sacelli]|uniref:Aspartyl-tRNA(Asn)/glutamyl-tRNA(Gln) amidotransferase subunit A n=1 Tax=Brachybacterium sacelli TaxID=173364 RepID=A0ABS4WYP5_9MICO|nr:amidase [Brachybacterium sacelli]MBP2381325.1 aspartyl-tRNA(Asn)/glutamyl-tRNA(Gln) amidotransferase subunit A [Brachybacterium sacelli]
MTSAGPLSLTQAAHALTHGATTSRALTEDCLARIAAQDADLRAFISVEADLARRQAEAADARLYGGGRLGTLDGLPIAVKDNLSTAGGVTTIGSAIFRDHVATENAGVVDRLEEQGAVRVGKTNLHEFALGVTTENPHFGICRNPWGHKRTPGGSSGGSAVAVATGMALAAIGSDTSGSIRIPAAACGLLGLKPTYGLVSSHGCYPEAWSLDHVGVLTRTAQDAAILLDALSGHDPRVPSSLRVVSSRAVRELEETRPLRIGLEERFFLEAVDPDIETIVREMLDSLARTGAQIELVALPSLDDAIYALTVIDTAETTAFHAEQFRERPQDYGEDVRLLLECGALPTAVDYLQAQQIRSRVRDEFRQVFEQVDVLASPTLPIRTPRVGESTVRVGEQERDRDGELMRLVGPANLAGLPSTSVPCGMLDGMPVGMQFVGPALGEGAVLRAAAAVEELFHLPPVTSWGEEG